MLALRRMIVAAAIMLASSAFMLVSTPAVTFGASTPAYPLKPSANNRYLVDQNNIPFLIAGDSPQAIIGNLSVAKAKTFIANRFGYGINALWINLICNGGTSCNSDGTTFDGIRPFTVAGDLSTPNPAYFQRAANIISLAAAKGMVVILDPIETIGWLGILEANGKAKAFGYGKYLGNRFRDYPNIIWMHGNDFWAWGDPGKDALVRAVARGIKSTDANHIHTIILQPQVSASLDDRRWRSIVELDAVYTYRPTYAEVLRAYKRANFLPVFMAEANYEFEHNPFTDGGSHANLAPRESVHWFDEITTATYLATE